MFYRLTLEQMQTLLDILKLDADPRVIQRRLSDLITAVMEGGVRND